MKFDTAPVAPASEPFDLRSGSVVERALFNHRVLVMVLCLLATAVLGWQATKLQLNASFEKTIPTHHPFIQNYLTHQNELSGLGNAVRIAVANPKGSIYDAAYLETLRKLSDEVFLVPGVARNQMKSLWTPTTRWVGVTEEGLEGGPVIPDGYDGSEKSLQQLAANIARSGELGQLVALDAKSSVIFVPLLARDAAGKTLDYAAFAERVETLRAKYEQQGVQIHVTGFAKIIGDLIEGVRAVLVFFAIAVAIAAAMVFWYTRCVRSTVLVVAASLIAVVWQLGLLPTLGFALDPYSILVPFLVFAIGMSHGAQKMNGIMQDVGRGMHKLVAARFTFRRLFLAGLTALLADAVGFAVLLVIDVQVIRELAIAASLGVGVLIFTNLILLPIGLSYVGVSPKAAAPACGTGRRSRSRQAPAVGLAGPLHAAARCDYRHRRRAGSGHRRLRGQHAAGDRRPRPRRARTAGRQPLQPRRGLRQCGLRRIERRSRGDGQDTRRAMLPVRHAQQDRRAGVAAAPD